MPDEFLEKLAHLAKDEDGMAERVLSAGAEVVEARVRSNLSGVIGRGTKEESRSTDSFSLPSARLPSSWTGTATTT